jgi:hypothetical protein
MDRISAFHADRLTRIAAYTAGLEKTPLEEFRTSVKTREWFITLLDAEIASDTEWLVEEIHSCHFNLAEVKHLKLTEEYEPQYAEFIVLGKAALARLAACFPPIKDIVLSGEFDEEFGFNVKSFHSAGEAVMKAFEADLTPRACCVFPVEALRAPTPPSR